MIDSAKPLTNAELDAFRACLEEEICGHTFPNYARFLATIDQQAAEIEKLRHAISGLTAIAEKVWTATGECAEAQLQLSNAKTEIARLRGESCEHCGCALLLRQKEPVLCEMMDAVVRFRDKLNWEIENAAKCPMRPIPHEFVDVPAAHEAAQPLHMRRDGAGPSAEPEETR